MKKFIFSLSIALSLFIVFNSVSAQVLKGSALEKMKKNANTVSTIGGFAAEASIGSIVAAIIQIALGLLAIIFLVLLVLAGFKYMMAQGNEEQIKAAMGSIKTAAIGLVIVLAAYAITYFIFTYLPFSGPGTAGNITTSGE